MSVTPSGRSLTFAIIQEQSLGIHYNERSDLLDYLKDPTVFAYKEGYVAVFEGPSLGSR